MEIVNGYVCRNCSDVSLAKRNVDPAHPKAGPDRVEAVKPVSPTPAVVFEGQLGETARARPPTPTQAPYRPGSTVSVSA